MKIALVAPPIQDFYDTEIRHYPLGLLYLASTLRHFHPEVCLSLFDFHHKRGKRTIPIPNELRSLKKFYQKRDLSPFSTFHHYYHFGEDFDRLVEEILEASPNLVGISSLFTTYSYEVLEITRRLKEKAPNVKIVLGGAHVSAMCEEVLREESVDYIIRGEGERGLKELVDHLKGEREITEVSSLGYKIEGKLFFNEIANFDIDEISVPLLSEFPHANYLIKEKPMAMVLTSRGCPYKCSFCATHEVFGRSFRQRKVQDVILEMKKLYERGVRIFDFEDDNLTLNKKFILSLCESIEGTFPKRDVELVAMNGISYWHLDQEILQVMKRAGFSKLNISLVSREKESTLLRPTDVEKFKEITHLACKLGFHVTGYYILGLPNEGLDSMISSLALLASLPLSIGASPFYLLPNSKLGEDVSFTREIILKSRLTALGDQSSMIYALFVLSRMLNFLKGLSFPKGGTLNEIFDLPFEGKERVGLQLIKKLREEKILSFYLGIDGYEPNPHFDYEIFKHLIEKLEFITTLQGSKLII